jgi:integrase
MPTKRTRRQKGSLQKRTQGGALVWVALYRDEAGSRRYYTIGKVSRMTKTAAEAKLAETVASVNSKDFPDPTLAEFIASAYFPHKRRNWKESTQGTPEQRINTHLVRDLEDKFISELRRELMAMYLEDKAKTGKSHSLVAHLRWDLKAVIDLAVADGIVLTNQAIALTVPKVKKAVSKATDTPLQAMRVIAALDLKERLISRLALYVGLRPGEILATRWHDLAVDSLRIERRVYKGKIDTVKNQNPRTVALPNSVVHDFEKWAELSFNLEPGAFIFPASEPGGPGTGTASGATA